MTNPTFELLITEYVWHVCVTYVLKKKKKKKLVCFSPINLSSDNLIYQAPANEPKMG